MIDSRCRVQKVTGFSVSHTAASRSLRSRRSYFALHSAHSARFIITVIHGLEDHLTFIALPDAPEADESAPPQRVARAVDGDAREPCFELGAALELGQVRVRLDECVLGNGVRFHVVPHDGKGNAKNP